MSRTPALASALGGLGRGLRGGVRAFVSLFSRSLQVRVVLLTMVLTAVALFGVGSYMTQVIARGLFESKLSSLSAQTNGYTGQLESLAADADLDEVLSVQLRSMYSRSPAPLRSITLEPREPGGGALPVTVSDRSEPVPVTAELPEDFLDQVHGAASGQQLYRSLSLSGDGQTPGLVVAQPVSVPGGGQFELYVMADLREEQSILDFVTRAVGVAGVVLVVLVGAVGLLVSRLVVTPIRTGAEVARQIADGDLDRRMPVAGRDEISQLAESFNDMADTLQDQITRMERLSVLQRQFVSDVSHELRTPLTTIHVASDMLYESREEFDETTRRSAELLNSQVDRFEALLGDLLEISRYDAGAAELVPHPHDLGEIVAGVVETVSVVAEKAGTRIRVHAPSTPVMAEVDRVRVTRVLRNLVVNAIEHGEGLPIDVYLATNAEAAAVSVRDHGVGMSHDAVEHVFDRFWRADPSRKRTLGGSGLGLAIALEDAHLHGGWLQAWGEPGEGSCFRLTIPRRHGQAITSSPLPLPPADAKQGQALVAGPSSSDGSIRIQTGSIPIVVDHALARPEAAGDAAAVLPGAGGPPVQEAAAQPVEAGGLSDGGRSDGRRSEAARSEGSAQSEGAAAPGTEGGADGVRR
ncbi:MtrAB system histidine kinase MtrB [Brevibacterium album]|uniref:MtrAB system histidine kinase MtrB n=1 Tax=Brevibacterium album TaxID=417948 RepID=UPI000412BBB3|nr:MtrAB system histidine kinase MtrB [Brevibacterium album]